MDTMQYRHPEPYPMPEHLEPNLRYAHVLTCHYSGPCSELTAVTQYIYHHLEAQEENPQAAECLRGIAVVEMRHLDLLGSCIRKLGLHPQYRYFRGNLARHWNASFVCYNHSFREMIQSDIQGEYAAIRQYEAAIACISDAGLQALLRRIIRDEELHIGILQSFL